MYSSPRIQSRTRAIGWSTVVASVAFIAFTGSAQAGSTSDKAQVESPFSRPCFMVRSHWNEALDGPQPTCPVPDRAVVRAHDYDEPAPEHGYARRHW